MKRFKGIPNMICIICGKPYHIYPSEKIQGQRRYCSWVCYRLDNKKTKKHTKNPNTNCLICGTPHYECPKYLLEGKKHYCSRTCYIKSLFGPANPNWKGGRGEKYLSIRWVKSPNDFRSMARKDGHVAEHRLVVAQYLGRLLRKKEVVHHKNGNRRDNRIENLELLANLGEHNLLHWQQNKWALTLWGRRWGPDPGDNRVR